MGEALQAELIQTQVGGPLENAAEFNKKKISPQLIFKKRKKVSYSLENNLNSDFHKLGSKI